MLKRFLLLLALFCVASDAQAQERPLSPPVRPPVPLTDSDQQRARAEELSKKEDKQPKTEPQKPVSGALQIKVPAILAGRHISSGNAAIDSLVHESAAHNGLDPCLILSVMRAESSFNRTAVSVKGASGLMQLMPATAARFGVRNIFDPRENVFAGAKYLRWLLDRFRGDVRLALAGYNAGEGAVEFYGYRIPPFRETQNYVKTIYGRYSGIHSGPQPEVVATSPKPITSTPVPPTEERFPTYNQIIRFTSSTGDSVGGKSTQ